MSARIEILCKDLGHSVLVSLAFAAAVARSQVHLVSLGPHRLRGVCEDTELFTLKG